MTSTDLVVQDGESTPSVSLFGSDDPAATLERQRELATTLTDFVRQQNLVVRIGQSDHLRVEAWTFLGSQLNVFPIVQWTRPVMEGEVRVGWEARVEARTLAGALVGAAESECLRTEKTWKGRDDYALKSMAQTRAVSKALRLPLGFIVVLAGYNPTPAEEMPVGDGRVVSDPPPADDGVPEPLQGDPSGPKFITDAQAKKLNLLVGKLRAADRDPTGWIYSRFKRAAAVVDATENEDRLHWSAIRPHLSRIEATDLIDKLSEFEAKL